MNRELTVQTGNGISAQNTQGSVGGDEDSLRLDDSRLPNMDDSSNQGNI